MPEGQEKLDQVLRECAKDNVPILGICLGLLEHFWHWFLNNIALICFDISSFPDDLGYFGNYGGKLGPYLIKLKDIVKWRK